jgi:hypothetical protein
MLVREHRCKQVAAASRHNSSYFSLSFKAAFEYSTTKISPLSTRAQDAVSLSVVLASLSLSLATDSRDMKKERIFAGSAEHEEDKIRI